MTTEDRLDDQGLKPEDQEDLPIAGEDEPSEEEKGIQSLEDQIAEVSEPDDDESEQADEKSEQPASDEPPADDDKPPVIDTEEELPANVDEKTKQAFIKLRLKNKELKERLEREAQEEAEKNQPIEKKVDEVEEPPKASAEYVLDVYLRALNDKLTDEEVEQAGSAEKVIQLAETALAKQLSSSDIYKAINNAIDTNHPDKDDIIDVGNKYLSLARYREEVASKDAEQATSKQQAEFQSELKQVAEAYPDLAQSESPLSAFMKEWDNRMLGKVVDGKVTQGELREDFAMYLRQHPLEHAKMIVDSFNLSAQSGAKAKEVIKKTARSRAVLGSGESGSPPLPADGGNKISTLEDIEAKMEAMSAEA